MSNTKKKRPRAANAATIVAASAGWSRHFPYEVDYCDHFETPKRAYVDISPLVRWIGSDTKSGKKEADICLYDPYYCNGRTKVLLNEMGFENVVHRCRDFYADIDNGAVPPFEVLITNPPYSDKHKRKCLEFAFDNLRTKGRPFFLLMPNYIAVREYFRAFVCDSQNHEVVYYCPPQSYQYDHPEGTGHVISPFQSIWYIGVGSERYKELKKRNHEDEMCSLCRNLYFSLEELKQVNLVPTLKRPNPRQRKKRQVKRQILEGAERRAPRSPPSPETQLTQQRKKRKSKHRNEQGVRTRRRF